MRSHRVEGGGGGGGGGGDLLFRIRREYTKEGKKGRKNEIMESQGQSLITFSLDLLLRRRPPSPSLLLRRGKWETLGEVRPLR